MMTKEYIKELVEKYFDAETTLEEESLIRGYFAEDDIDPDLEPYTALFRTFSRDREEYMSECEVGGRSSKRIRLRSRYYIMLIAGAAVLLMGLFLIGKDSNPVLIINGEKINNTELAIAIAGESLNNMNMAMEKIQGNAVHLEKIGKIGVIMSSFEEMNRALSQKEEEDRLNSELKDGYTR